MLFFIRYQDTEYQVRVETRQDQVFVKFNDEKEQVVDLVYQGNDCSFLQNEVVFNGNITGVKTDYTVWKPEGNMTFTLESEYRRIVGMLRGQELGNENAVYAKMPGKIVKVSVKKGDVVEKSAAVIVMEAMKMENEIRSPLTGTISNVCVKEGQAVETGTLLLEFEPAEN